jgi:hypothetical protein
MIQIGVVVFYDAKIGYIPVSNLLKSHNRASLHVSLYALVYLQKQSGAFVCSGQDSSDVHMAYTS